MDKIEIKVLIEKKANNFKMSLMDILNNLKLHQLLENKNLYLYKAKKIWHVAELIDALLDDFLYKQEEKLFEVYLLELETEIGDDRLVGYSELTKLFGDQIAANTIWPTDELVRAKHRLFKMLMDNFTDQYQLDWEKLITFTLARQPAI